MKASHEKITSDLIGEMIKHAQPFKVYFYIDQSWSGIFDIDLPEEDFLIDIYTDEENIINAYIEQKKDGAYFNYIMESDIIKFDNKKIKLSIPIRKLLQVVIDDGSNVNFIANPCKANAYELDEETLESFRIE